MTAGTERLRCLLDSFAHDIQRRERDLSRPAGGQRVPPGGDFVNVTPSTLGRLRWWHRELTDALAQIEAERDAPPPVVAQAVDVLESALIYIDRRAYPERYEAAFEALAALKAVQR